MNHKETENTEKVKATFGRLMHAFHTNVIKVFCLPDLTLTCKNILVSIVVHQGRNEFAYVSQQTIAEECDCSRSSVNRAINQLVRAGYVNVSDSGTPSVSKKFYSADLARIASVADGITGFSSVSGKTDDGRTSVVSCQNSVSAPRQVVCQNATQDCSKMRHAPYVSYSAQFETFDVSCAQNTTDITYSVSAYQPSRACVNLKHTMYQNEQGMCQNATQRLYKEDILPKINTSPLPPTHDSNTAAAENPRGFYNGTETENCKGSERSSLQNSASSSPSETEQNPCHSQSRTVDSRRATQKFVSAQPASAEEVFAYGLRNGFRRLSQAQASNWYNAKVRDNWEFKGEKIRDWRGLFLSFCRNTLKLEEMEAIPGNIEATSIEECRKAIELQEQERIAQIRKEREESEKKEKEKQNRFVHDALMRLAACRSIQAQNI